MEPTNIAARTICTRSLIANGLVRRIPVPEYIRLIAAGRYSAYMIIGSPTSKSKPVCAAAAGGQARTARAVLRRIAIDILRAHPDNRYVGRKIKLAAWKKEFFFELFAYLRWPWGGVANRAARPRSYSPTLPPNRRSALAWATLRA
jgi:hypothetical protein